MKERINIMKVPELLKEAKGRFVTITFEKLDKSIRKMNCRFGVSKGVKGTGKSKTVHKSNPYLTVWDAQAQSFRTINLSTIKEVCSCGKTYEVV